MIELLVVIAIIIIAGTFVLVFLTNARTRSRDTQRISQVEQIQNALHLYAADNNGIFPVSEAPLTVTGEDTLSTTLKGKYIPDMPTDPQHPSLSYTYQTNAAGSTYTLSFCLETNTINNYVQGCGNTVVQ